MLSRTVFHPFLFLDSNPLGGTAMYSDSDYLEIMHRAIRSDRSLLNYIQKDTVEEDDQNSNSHYFNALVECEGYPSYIVHMHQGTHEFSSEIEWID